MTDDRPYRKFYLAALSATGFFLPLSIWLLTFFIIVLVIIWVAGGGIRRMHQLIREKRNISIFCIIYLVYLIWIVNTSDISFGLRELKIKAASSDLSACNRIIRTPEPKRAEKYYFFLYCRGYNFLDCRNHFKIKYYIIRVIRYQGNFSFHLTYTPGINVSLRNILLGMVLFFIQ